MSNTLRFKVGDLARVVRDDGHGKVPGVVGEIVEIISIGAYGSWNGVPWKADYGIKIRGLEHRLCGANDHELAPLPGDDSSDFIPPAVRELFKPAEAPKAPARKTVRV